MAINYLFDLGKVLAFFKFEIIKNFTKKNPITFVIGFFWICFVIFI